MFPENKWELRRDLTGVVFRTASNHDPPFVETINIEKDNVYSSPLPRGYFVENDSSTLTRIFLGPSLYGDIWSLLQNTFNFTYSMV